MMKRSTAIICLSLFVTLVLHPCVSLAAPTKIRISGRFGVGEQGEEIRRVVAAKFPSYEFEWTSSQMGKFEIIAATLASGEYDIVVGSSSSDDSLMHAVQQMDVTVPSGKYGTDDDMFAAQIRAVLKGLAGGTMTEEQALILLRQTQAEAQAKAAQKSAKQVQP